MKVLFGEYTYAEVTYEEVQAVFKTKRSEVFSEEFTIETELFLTERENTFYKTLPKNEIYRLYILVYKNNEPIGWHIGFQKFDTFYMMNTGVFQEHQGKGIYKKLLQEIIHIVEGKGFLSITSRHIMSNNKVIVPKLKTGFLICGFEIEERFGTLVNLKYFFNQEIKNVYLMRTGTLKPTKKMLNK